MVYPGGWRSVHTRVVHTHHGREVVQHAGIPPSMVLREVGRLYAPHGSPLMTHRRQETCMRHVTTLNTGRQEACMRLVTNL